MWRADDGESTTRPLGIHFCRIDKGHIDGLPGLECKSGGLVESEREGVPCHDVALSQGDQLDVMGGHAASPVRVSGAEQTPLAQESGAFVIRANAEWLWMDSKFSASTSKPSMRGSRASAAATSRTRSSTNFGLS